MSDVIKHDQPFADGIAAIFHPHVEVVIHDLKTQTVVYVANNFSKRTLGDYSALDNIDFDVDEPIFGPYQKINWDGRIIRSVNIVRRDDSGTPRALFCINMDLSVFEMMRASLGVFLENSLSKPRPEKLFRDDWQDRINTFLNGWLADRGLTLSSVSGQEKRELIEALLEVGAFNGRSAAPYIASILGLSRATIFNQLKRLRQKDPQVGEASDAIDERQQDPVG